MASSRGSTASSKPPKQRLAVTAQSATSKPWFTCSQPNSISCFQTEIVATHAKQRRTDFFNITLGDGAQSRATPGQYAGIQEKQVELPPLQPRGESGRLRN